MGAMVWHNSEARQPKHPVLVSPRAQGIWATRPWARRNSQGGVGSPCEQMVER